MTPTVTEYSDSSIMHMMHDANVRISIHRMAVTKYVANKKTHPTADEIFNALSGELPSLSRTTIYNSLHALVDAGLLRELEVDRDGATRYDLLPQPPHSHFTCSACGRIYDMAIPESLESIVSDGFRIDAVDLYFKGLCPECIKKS